MLRVVGEARRIERAIRRLQSALKGVAARGVRLTWRGGELRTTIHWARDDSFWWAFEPRRARDALLLGHAPDAPAKRESITCEINLPKGGADRRGAGKLPRHDRKPGLPGAGREAMIGDISERIVLPEGHEGAAIPGRDGKRPGEGKRCDGGDGEAGNGAQGNEPPPTVRRDAALRP